MDPRSLQFLHENNIKHDFHTPKKISKKMLDYFDKFLAVDFFILSQLNLTYPKYRNKFASFSAQFSDVNIIDPYNFDDNKYLRTMNDIKFVAENINLETLD